jgi:hypothetical protein
MDGRAVRAESSRSPGEPRGTRLGREAGSRSLGAFGAPSASKQGTSLGWLRDSCCLGQGLAARPWVACTKAWRRVDLWKSRSRLGGAPLQGRPISVLCELSPERPSAPVESIIPPAASSAGPRVEDRSGRLESRIRPRSRPQEALTATTRRDPR